MPIDVHHDFLMDLVAVVSNCFGEYHFVLGCVSYDLYDDARKDSYHVQSQIDINLCAWKNLKGQSDSKDFIR